MSTLIRRRFRGAEHRRQRTQRLRVHTDRPCAGEPPQLQLYCPAVATPRQREFLELRCRESFYGGAAGGGKSTALLMGALQYAYLPGFSALILRRDIRRLRLSGGLIPKSHEWLLGRGAKWNDQRTMWTFPHQPPATITFGYLLSPLDRFRYGSSEYQYVAFDELTEFDEEDYVFLFSRLRSTRDKSAPLRICGAGNPGGPGHLWVKNRFVDRGRCSAANEPAFVFARIADNPHLDAQEYRQSLLNLPPVTRASGCSTATGRSKRAACSSTTGCGITSKAGRCSRRTIRAADCSWPSAITSAAASARSIRPAAAAIPPARMPTAAGP